MPESTMACADDAAVLIARRPLIPTLPDDILSNIFLILFQMCRDDKQSEDHSRKYKDRAVFVTHVCKRWRSVALDYASIWAFIDATSYSLAQIRNYLARSKNSKLTVYLSFTIKKADSIILKLLQDHIWRIKVFHLFSNEFASSLSKYPFLLDTAHNLRFLSLYCENDSRFDSGMPSPDLLNSEVTSSQSPSLRELVLHKVISYSTIPWLNTVTSLTLSYMEIKEAVLLEILAQCSPRLLLLSLCDILISDKTTPAPLIHPIEFPVLRDFTTFAEFICNEDLSQYVKFPKSVNWKLINMLHNFNLSLNDDYKFYFRLDGFRYLPTEICPENEELKITLNRIKRSIELFFSGKTQNLPNQSPQNQQIIDVALVAQEYPYWPILVKSCVHRIPDILPPRISKLELAFYFEARWGLQADIDVFKNVVRRMENLKSLKISFCGEGEKDVDIYRGLQFEILAILEPSMFTNNESESEITDLEIWPEFEVLTLNKFHFGDKDFLDDFIEFLSIWKKRCIRLNIDDAHALPRDSIDRIRNTVSGVFYVDGIEIVQD